MRGGRGGVEGKGMGGWGRDWGGGPENRPDPAFGRPSTDP